MQVQHTNETVFGAPVAGFAIGISTEEAFLLEAALMQEITHPATVRGGTSIDYDVRALAANLITKLRWFKPAP